MKSMKKYFFFVAISMVAFIPSFGQHTGLTFQEAKDKGIKTELLDSLYKSAVHADASKAVFKTEAEEEMMGQAYVVLLRDFGKFLKENNFKWDEPIGCFNRVYFNNDGTIDYFLYKFINGKSKPGAELSPEKEKEFNRLLNLFIQDHSIRITAREKFAQCSPVTYQPSK
jgi:hypothetical protein